MHLTLAVPNMILGETALSFIGLGLKPPVVSWGVLLTSAQNFRTVALSPWLLIPVLFVVVTGDDLHVLRRRPARRRRPLQVTRRCRSSTVTLYGFPRSLLASGW